MLYLIGDPEDPIAVWKKLGDQFQKKTWLNKLELGRKLHSLRLREGDCVLEHIKAMTELFDALSVVGDPVYIGRRQSGFPTSHPARIVRHAADGTGSER